MEKKKIVISSITVAVLLVLVVASTYAYFQARIASGGQTSTSVGAKTLDSFAINKGNDISLIANQDNFALGKGDLSSSTTATVSFTARNDEASSYAYNVRFYIALNEFWYSSTTDTEQFDANGNSYGKAILSYSNYPSYNLLPDFDDAGWQEINSIKTTFYGQNAIKLSYDSDVSYSFGNELTNTTVTPLDWDCYVKYDYSGDVKRPVYTSISLFGPCYYEPGEICNFSSDGVGLNEYNEYLGNNIYHWWYTGMSGTEEDLENLIYFYMSIGNSTYSSAPGDVTIYSPICVDKNTTEGANFDINDYYKYVDPVPELELTIKKNGEVLLDSYDIINGLFRGQWIGILPTKEYTDKANQDYDALYWDVLMPSYNYCITNYYPTYGNYFDEYGNEINGGYDAFVEEICGDDSSCIDIYNYRRNICWPGYQIVSSEAGKTTTDTWEATVTFKNLDGNQNINLGKAFEGYFQINSYKDYSSEEIVQSHFEKCMQKWDPSFDVNEYIGNGGYDSYIQTTCNNDYESECARRLGTCSELWW